MDSIYIQGPENVHNHISSPNTKNCLQGFFTKEVLWKHVQTIIESLIIIINRYRSTLKTFGASWMAPRATQMMLRSIC